ncbi:MAG: EAL domain-containing protein [Gammaproteobacteria bacterium]|nr:EAL domain-containing protein [Gammaproteobacteria bacterium]
MLVFAGIFAIFAMVVDLYTDYQRIKEDTVANVRQMANELRHPLDSILWMSSEHLTNVVLESILSLPAVAAVELESEDRQFVLGEMNPSTQCDHQLNIDVPVTNQITNALHHTAKMSLCITTDGAVAGLIERFTTTLAINTVKAFLLTLILLNVTTALVSRPLESITRKIRGQSPQTTPSSQAPTQANEITEIGSALEQALIDIRHEYQSAQSTLNSLGEGVVVLDQNDIILRENRAAKTILGSQHSLIGQKLFDQAMINPHSQWFTEAKLRCSQLSLPIRSPSFHLKNGKTLRITLTQKNTYSIAVLSDFTRQHRLQQEVRHLATHDTLTGTHNRWVFENKLQECLSELRDTQKLSCVIVVAIDNFTLINDQYGNNTGDELLQIVARRLTNCLSEDDALARIGGDEFGLLIKDAASAPALCEDIISQFAASSVHCGHHALSVSVRIGARQISPFSANPGQVLTEANIAASVARDRGGSQVVYFENVKDESSGYRNIIQWREKLDLAFKRKRFTYSLQPIVDAQSDQVVAYEMLSRIQLDDGSFASPNQYIPAAERFGHIQALDLLMVKLAINHLRKHDRATFRLNVNLSGDTLSSPRLIQQIEILLKTSDVSQRLCFEITETAAVKNLELASSHLQRLKAQGSYIALDDFGTGVTSLQHLKRLPIDTLKIDGIFIKRLSDNAFDRQLIASITSLAKTMDIKVVAEYVTHREQANYLRSIGVDFLQGHLYGPATEPKELDDQPQDYLDLANTSPQH